MSETFLQKWGVQRRMKCTGRTARRIENAFVTADQLVEAVESDEDLTEHEGIGPKTAEKIEEWYENRFERERAMPETTMSHTGARSATLHLHNSWADALGMEEDDE